MKFLSHQPGYVGSFYAQCVVPYTFVIASVTDYIQINKTGLINATSRSSSCHTELKYIHFNTHNGHLCWIYLQNVCNIFIYKCADANISNIWTVDSHLICTWKMPLAIHTPPRWFSFMWRHCQPSNISAAHFFFVPLFTVVHDFFRLPFTPSVVVVAWQRRTIFFLFSIASVPLLYVIKPLDIYFFAAIVNYVAVFVAH